MSNPLIPQLYVRSHINNFIYFYFYVSKGMRKASSRCIFSYLCAYPRNYIDFTKINKTFFVCSRDLILNENFRKCQYHSKISRKKNSKTHFLLEYRKATYCHTKFAWFCPVFGCMFAWNMGAGSCRFRVAIGGFALLLKAISYKSDLANP